MDEELSIDSDIERRKQRKSRKAVKAAGLDDDEDNSPKLSPFRLALCAMMGELVTRRDLS